ncbi:MULTISPECIES: hypothetical protein [unclassified Microcoleus]|jgi:hypothetical protein|uniref:hypothetical protein n=1 Tax=unclassified Microcoleus TaxID=2642155 RepID=UPI002FD571E5
MVHLGSGEQKKDTRLIATIWIWVLSIFSLLACVPILALTENSFFLPFAVLISVTISTASIWFFGKPINSENDKKLQILQARIENLETISDVIEFDKKLINDNDK